MWIRNNKDLFSRSSGKSEQDDPVVMPMGMMSLFSLEQTGLVTYGIMVRLAKYLIPSIWSLVMDIGKYDYQKSVYATALTGLLYESSLYTIWRAESSSTANRYLSWNGFRRLGHYQ